jgi:hypothetical protein
VTYEQRRDAYMAHLKACKVCVSSYSDFKYSLDNAGNSRRRKMECVSLFCPDASRLLDEVI